MEFEWIDRGYDAVWHGYRWELRLSDGRAAKIYQSDASGKCVITAPCTGCKFLQTAHNKSRKADGLMSAQIAALELLGVSGGV